MLSSLYSPHILKTDEKYKETWFFNVPNLRFNSFQGEWKKERIGNYIKEVKFYNSDFDKYPLFTFSIENGVTPKTDRYERGFLVKKDGDTFKVIKRNQFLMNPMNLRFGAINYSKVENPVSVSGYYDIFEIDEMKNNDFWYGLLSNNKAMKIYNSIATGSLIEKKRVHFSQLINTKFYLPSFDEREKISHLLGLINFRIDVQNKIITNLESLIKQINDEIFSGVKNRLMKDCIKEISIRNKNGEINNVLSVSNKFGFIKQSEQFEDKEVASEDKSNYKVIQKGVFAYNPARINVGSIALYDKNELGIVSPMYTCFKCNDDLEEILKMFFKSKSFKKEMSKRLEGSVRMCLTIDAMKNIRFHMPDPLEKKRLSLIEKLISKKVLETQILNFYLNEKQYLLSNLFI